MQKGHWENGEGHLFQVLGQDVASFEKQQMGILIDIILPSKSAKIILCTTANNPQRLQHVSLTQVY